jgi:GntR family transcriptional regulator
MLNLTQQIAERIKKDLRSGELDTTGRLPGYRVLGQRYQVSDGTARKALGLLEAASVLHRRDRSGTYVSPLFLKEFNVFCVMR